MESDAELMAEHMWSTAQMPYPLRGRRLEACKEIEDKTVAAAREFVETFATRRWVHPNCHVEHMPADRSLLGVGMTLSGPAGRGKTTLACAILTEVALTYRKTIYFVASADYLHAVYSRHGSLVPDEERHALQTVYHHANHAALLVLDDMGSEMVANSASAQKEFSRLLRSRYNRANPTIITSNLGRTGWAEAYGHATASFLHQAAPILTMAGPSLRGGA